VEASKRVGSSSSGHRKDQQESRERDPDHLSLAAHLDAHGRVDPRPGRRFRIEFGAEIRNIRWWTRPKGRKPPVAVFGEIPWQ